MPDIVDLSEYVATLDLPDEISREWLLDGFLAPLGVPADGIVAEVCEDVFLAGSGEVGGALQMRPGGWRVDVAGTVARTILASALVAGGLAADGKDDITAELIPAVLPLLADVKRVRLDRRDRTLLVPLRLAAFGLEGSVVNPQVVYDRLDATLRDQLNYLDFLSFCERLVEAGEMDDGGYDDIRVRRADRPAWIRITLT